MNREELSHRYLRAGMTVLEIAAYHNPFPANGAKVFHTCKLMREALVHMAENDPNLKGCDLTKIPHTDFVCDGARLDVIPEGWTFDAIINSHVLEHLPNPIQAIQTWLGRLNTGGLIIMAVPNKDHTFDKPRPVTPFPWLEEVFLSSGAAANHEYLQVVEWYTLVDKKPNPDAMWKGWGKHDIHFNVWDKPAMLGFIAKTNEILGNPYQVELFQPDGHEFFIVLRKIK